MGGPGSGSWYRRQGKKATVESCRHPDANRWMREGILQEDVWHAGSWAWFRDASRTEQAAALGYEVNTQPPAAWVRLFYTLTATNEAMDYRVQLARTRPHFGGCRWWFICPLAVNGHACGKRVAKLYLRGKYFGCRHCYDLSTDVARSTTSGWMRYARTPTECRR